MQTFPQMGGWGGCRGGVITEVYVKVRSEAVHGDEEAKSVQGLVS